MAFLDNSGDIILDAVLTDTGRMRLAQGAFAVTHYAFGDDEINYALYRNSNHPSGAHPSGSAYYDLDILQTPILEAFTDNTANLKSRLVTYNTPAHIHLPIIMLNETRPEWQRNSAGTGNNPQARGKFVVAVDEETANPFSTGTVKGLFQNNIGMMKGISPGAAAQPRIRIDQGLNTNSPTPSSQNLSTDLKETEYTVEMDNRLGTVWWCDDGVGTQQAPLSFVDDDQIALYKLVSGTGVHENGNKSAIDTDLGSDQVIKGPRGTYIMLRFASSELLRTSPDLFEKIGVLNATWTDSTGDAVVHYIDTVVRVRGITTGYKIDFPVRFVKLAATR